jgi:predicted transcriptional regulator
MRQEETEKNLATMERKVRVTEMCLNQGRTTLEMAEALGTTPENIRHDIRVLNRRGVMYTEEKKGVCTLFRANRLVTVAELSRKGVEGAIKKTFNPENIPPSLLLMYGYTEFEPKGGVFVDNADFMPTPVRTAPVKVYPGTSWGDIALRMPG